MLFQKPSLRTRVTFEAGMTQLGGHAIYLTESIVLGGRETVADVARNLERFVDAIMARTGPHEVVVELAQRASIPVINGLTIREHPCQALADLFTVSEVVGGDLRGVPLAFVGDGNNVYHSLALLGATLGMEIRLAHPVGYGPNERIVARARELAAANGGRLVFEQDARAVVEGAAIVYTDAWTSMGQEAEAEERRDAFAPYQVNRDLMAMAPDAIVMHCLPAHRGEEITNDVMDGPQSRIFEQSENRLHAQKALLVELIAGAG
jgi:ornithine carbamoyltransferase